MDRIKTVLLTSNKLRHIWVANKISGNFNLIGIISEPKSRFYKEASSESKIIARHFELNDLYEKSYFGEYRDFPGCDKLFIKRGDINSDTVIKWVKDKMPDIIMLYGTGLLKKGWFDDFGKGIINMHLGLSPYYRGSGTNFWPLVNREPEYIGVTIHIATTGIDAGDIICQTRPKIEITDSVYDIGTKAIVEGVNTFIKGVKRYIRGERPLPQKELFNGYERVYRREDFNEKSVLIAQRNFNEGMIDKYLKNFEDRVAKVKIVT